MRLPSQTVLPYDQDVFAAVAAEVVRSGSADQEVAAVVGAGIETKSGLEVGGLARKSSPNPGTTPYMSPEQIRSDKAAVSKRSDVYSPGVTLYELLTGTLPFAGDSYESLRNAILEKKSISPRQLVPTIPVDLAAICMKCLEKEPANRYATPKEFADHLQDFLDGKPISIHPIVSSGHAVGQFVGEWLAGPVLVDVGEGRYWQRSAARQKHASGPDDRVMSGSRNLAHLIK